MSEITIAQEKAHEAIDLLKEAVLAIVRHETETGSGVSRADIRDQLKIGKEHYPPPKDINWDMGQVVFTILQLLKADSLIDRSKSDAKKWVLLKSNPP